MNFLGSKKMKSDRIILRPTEKSDLKVLWSILLKPEVNKYYLSTKISENWENEEKYQLKKLSKANDLDVFQWSIVLKETNECIGQISVQEGYTSDLSIRDIGWFINPLYQRKGYSTEAANMVLDYMFNVVKINKIVISSAVENIGSWKLMEKLGFKRIETFNFTEYTYAPGDIESYRYEICSY